MKRTLDAAEPSPVFLSREKRQRLALEKIAARRHGHEEGGIVILDDSDDDAPGPSNPPRIGDTGQGCNKDGGDYNNFYRLLGM